MKLKLFIFSPPHKRTGLYELMGPFFGDRIYRTRFPYLINSGKTVWYLLINEKREVMGFTSYEKLDGTIEIGDFYVSEKIDEKYYRKFLLKKVLRDIKNTSGLNKIRTAVNCKAEKLLFEEHGFVQYRKTKNYYFLKRKESYL